MKKPTSIILFLALLLAATALTLLFPKEKKPEPQPPSSAIVFDGGMSVSMLKLHGFSNVVIFVNRGGLTGRIVVKDETNGILTAPVEYPK